MIRYPAFIDGEAGAYGVAFPDIPGIVAMSETVDQAMIDAEEALRDYALEAERDGITPVAPTPLEAVQVPPGATLITVPLIRLSGRPVRANLNLDEDVLAFIDAEASRRKMTRTGYVHWMVRTIAQSGV